MTILDAQDYIKASNFYTSEKYQWARPIIEAVLKDEFDHTFIYEFIEKLYAGILAQESSAEDPVEAHKEVNPEVSSTFSLQQINSISKIENIGLVDIKDPVAINDGINIIYGKNASGKSSLYVSLCNVLGISKSVYPNITSDSSDYSVQVSVKDIAGEDHLLEWNGGVTPPVKGVRIFDTDVCSFLVEKDQVNQFELAHLKSEYFPLLNNAYSDIGTALEKCKFKIHEGYTIAYEKLLKVFPGYPEYEENLTKENFKKLEFTNEKKERLLALEAEINLLSKKDIESVIKNFSSAENAGRRILSVLGEVSFVSQDGQDSLIWAYGLNDKLVNAEEILKEHQGLKEFDLPPSIVPQQLRVLSSFRYL